MKVGGKMVLVEETRVDPIDRYYYIIQISWI